MTTGEYSFGLVSLSARLSFLRLSTSSVCNPQPLRFCSRRKETNSHLFVPKHWKLMSVRQFVTLTGALSRGWFIDHIRKPISGGSRQNFGGNWQKHIFCKFLIDWFLCHVKVLVWRYVRVPGIFMSIAPKVCRKVAKNPQRCYFALHLLSWSKWNCWLTLLNSQSRSFVFYYCAIDVMTLSLLATTSCSDVPLWPIFYDFWYKW